MRVLHINYSDSIGGAAIAAYRHHEAMRLNGIDSKMLVIHKGKNDPNVVKYKVSILKNFFYRIINKLFVKYYNFFASWSWNHYGYDISNHKEIKEADIIIIHWINNYTLSLESLSRILDSEKPIFWFMHDMWPLTGGCHHAFDCEKYKTACGNCIMMHNHNGSKRNHDISFMQFQEKVKRLTKRQNLNFITPSFWLMKNVSLSSLFKDNEVKVCRNVLNTDIFKPADKREARVLLNLPTDKKIILFGAENISSPYKGWRFLKEALNYEFNDTVCVVYGNNNSESFKEINIPVINLGKINNLDNLIALYSACDVFVSPSLADNYPNVLIEAMACGLVCVGFNTGGIPEIITDGVNGKIVYDFNGKSLYDSINYVLNCNNYQQLSKNAIDSINKNNNYSNVIILNNNGKV